MRLLKTLARAGLCAEEIHVCGETAAIDFIKELMYTTGEEVEVSSGGLITICSSKYVNVTAKYNIIY